jgi:hypothetical protein
MSRATRNALDNLERHVGFKRNFPGKYYWFLVIVRSAMDMREAHNIRIRTGLITLLKTLGLSIPDLIKALRNRSALLRSGIIRSTDNLKVISIFSQYLKFLDRPGAIGLQEQNQMISLADQTAQEFDKRLETYQRKRLAKRLKELQERKVQDQRERNARLASVNTKLSSSTN